MLALPQGLQKLLKRVHKDIEDLGYINKMAADQYTNFIDQRAMLEKREDELNRSEYWIVPIQYKESRIPVGVGYDCD